MKNFILKTLLASSSIIMATNSFASILCYDKQSREQLYIDFNGSDSFTYGQTGETLFTYTGDFTYTITANGILSIKDRIYYRTLICHNYYVN